jgi:hypothetical protein
MIHDVVVRVLHIGTEELHDNADSRVLVINLLRYFFPAQIGASSAKKVDRLSDIDTESYQIRNSTALLSAHSMDHHLIFSGNCFSGESCRNVQIIQANYIIFARKLVEHEKDSRMQGGTLLLQIFLGSSYISKVERVSVPVLTDTVSLKPVSFFLVANSLFVLMSSLKANGLLITGKMFANIPSLHTDTIDMAQKIINLMVGMRFS